jgi:adenine-specific DNA-methyltransferase
MDKFIEKDVSVLGQVFTPDFIVERMLALRRRNGSILEPSCGDGAFLNRLGPKAVGLEIDKRFKGKNIRNMDFFDLPLSEKFQTIIGNPPYVRHQDIQPYTKSKIDLTRFDKRTNLYLPFIEKSVKHLVPGGELIFITPRDFLKATAAKQLNEFLYEQGTITDFEDLGDARIFDGFTPNCAIWRFEKGNYSRKTNLVHEFVCSGGQLMFTSAAYPVSFAELFSVKVGAVSGDDEIFSDAKHGNLDFVCSTTVSDGKTRRMIYETKAPALAKHKARLMARRIKKFDESNWWKWGRDYFHTDAPRVYVNCKTRRANPFFWHPAKAYDGSVMAILPKRKDVDLNQLAADLNRVDWKALGFVCGGRFLFTQRSLENCRLPASFKRYAPRPSGK